MRDDHPYDKSAAQASVLPEQRVQYTFDANSDKGSRGFCNPRTWRRRIWVGIAILVVIIVVASVVPAVLLNSGGRGNSFNNSYVAIRGYPASSL